jgi:hypothetical protein
MVKQHISTSDAKQQTINKAKELKSMLDEGIITKEEFSEHKKALLDNLVNNNKDVDSNKAATRLYTAPKILGIIGSALGFFTGIWLLSAQDTLNSAGINTDVGNEGFIVGMMFASFITIFLSFTWSDNRSSKNLLRVIFVAVAIGLIASSLSQFVASLLLIIAVATSSGKTQS